MSRDHRNAVRMIVVAVLGVLSAAQARADVLAQEKTPGQAQRMADSLFRGRFVIDDADPERNVPCAADRAAAPLDFATFLMELGERAERATQRGDHRSATKYLTALTRAVPEEAAGYARLCDAYEAAGDRIEALHACANAVGHEGATLADFNHYVRLVLASNDVTADYRIQDLDALMQHLAAAAPDSLVPAQLRCDIGVRLADSARLTECTAVLRARAPNDAKTSGYEWVLAMQRKDYAAAAAAIERARHNGMRPDGLAVLERATRDAASPYRRAAVSLRLHSTLTIALAGLVLAASVVLLLRRRLLSRAPALIGSRPAPQAGSQRTPKPVTGVEMT